MSTLTQIRLAFAVIGIVVWGYGYRIEDSTIRLFGIGLLLVALLLRFAQRRAAEKDEAA